MKTLQQIDWRTSLKESSNKIKGYQIDWLKWTLAVTVLSIIGSGVYSAIVNL